MKKKSQSKQLARVKNATRALPATQTTVEPPPSAGVSEQALPTTQPTVDEASKPAVESPPFDPERDELVHDERGELYVRRTPLGMLEDAEEEVNQRELAEYHESIYKLRQKGLSFREIAEFLTKRGVYADHNAVYRVYTSHMTEDEIRMEESLEAQIEAHNRP